MLSYGPSKNGDWYFHIKLLGFKWLCSPGGHVFFAEMIFNLLLRCFRAVWDYNPIRIMVLAWIPYLLIILKLHFGYAIIASFLNILWRPKIQNHAIWLDAKESRHRAKAFHLDRLRGYLDHSTIIYIYLSQIRFQT